MSDVNAREVAMGCTPLKKQENILKYLRSGGQGAEDSLHRKVPCQCRMCFTAAGICRAVSIYIDMQPVPGLHVLLPRGLRPSSAVLVVAIQQPFRCSRPIKQSRLGGQADLRGTGNSNSFNTSLNVNYPYFLFEFLRSHIILCNSVG